MNSVMNTVIVWIRNMAGVWVEVRKANEGKRFRKMLDGIHTRGNSANSFALATKKTMTYCRKCICLC